SGNKNRLLSYLYAALGPSGPSECVPSGDKWPDHDTTQRIPIDHVVLSHPHKDHNSMLADVVHCYDVRNFWDSGDPYSSDVYWKLIQTISSEPNVNYFTAAAVSSSLTIDGVAVDPPASWQSFDDTAVVKLGRNANLKMLHADGASYPDDA